jgi:predicted ATPase
MLTQIEIDGFKTFKDFQVELAPFQVIVGPNGSGKSNLFDALLLLSHLTENDLSTAFQGLRGDAGELFTTLPGGKSVDRIRIAVEMLVDRKVRDDLGKEEKLKYTRLRYELEITQGTDIPGLERLYVRHELLQAIPPDKDRWCEKYNLSSQNGWLPEYIVPEANFIDTGYAHYPLEEDVNFHSDTPIINLYPDSNLYHGEQIREYRAQYNSRGLQRSVLSSVSTTNYPHIFAAREELRSLRFLHLNPEVLRQPGSIKDPRFLTQDGRNLPTTLVRMQAEDEFAVNDVSLDLANLVPDLTDIELKRDEVRNEYTIWANYMDGRSFSSRVLSDGTLRLPALTILRNDPQFHGILCIEEPENGVNPRYLKKIGRLLRKMATDFDDPEQVDEPLRQVSITTHSPTFISQPEVIDNLIFAFTVTRVEPRQYSMEITCMIPVVTPDTQPQLSMNRNRDETMEVYTLDQVIKYLDSEGLDAARELLERARTSLNEGQ